MKFIDKDIFDLLKRTGLTVQQQSIIYPDSDRDSYNFIMFSVVDNKPNIFADDKELDTEYIVNIEIYSEHYDTDKIAVMIDDLITTTYLTAKRTTCTSEQHYTKFNKRDIVYLINN